MRDLHGWRRMFPWSWWRLSPPPARPCEAAALAEARQAAEDHLRRAHELAPEVAQVARTSRRLRTENHFAELITQTFRSH